MAKKSNKKVHKLGRFDENIKNKIILVVGILCFFSFFYLLTSYITNKNSSDMSDTENNNATDEVSISYENIIVGRTFSMGDGDYLVLYYDKSLEDINSVYSQLVNNYVMLNEHLDIYTVDMSSNFNKSYTTVDEANKNPSNASEIKINGPTLIKISNGKVADYIEGEESISNYLK